MYISAVQLNLKSKQIYHTYTYILSKFTCESDIRHYQQTKPSYIKHLKLRKKRSNISRQIISRTKTIFDQIFYNKIPDGEDGRV